jgi:hypothetical protein
MNRSRVSLLAFSLSITTAVLACDSGEEPSAPVTAGPILSGIYRPAALGPATKIQEIAFRDTHYRLTPLGCDEARCEETGTFAVDFGSRRLDLVADGSGTRSSFPFAVLATKTALLKPASLEDEKREEPLVGEPEQLLDNQATSFRLLDAEYNLASGKPLSYSKTLSAKPWAPGVCQSDGYGGIKTCDDALDPKADAWKESLENAKDLECIGPFASYDDKQISGTTCGYDCTYKYEVKCCPKATPARWGSGDRGWDNAYCKEQ